MKPSRFTEEQIIGILKQAQAGMKFFPFALMLIPDPRSPTNYFPNPCFFSLVNFFKSSCTM